MLSETRYSSGKGNFKDNTFSAQEWSAPTMVSPEEIRRRIDGFKLCGRKVKHMRMIGLSYFHIRDCVEDAAYRQMKNLPEEERQRKSNYTFIDSNMQFNRCAEIDEPLLVVFEDGDIFEIDTPQEPEFCMSMNCIPWWIGAGTNQPNVDADILFSPCIGQTVTSVEVNTYMTDKEPMSCMAFDSAPHQREFVSNITLRFENGISLQIGAFIDYCEVKCVDSIGGCVQLSFSELKKALFNREDLHDDGFTDLHAESDIHEYLRALGGARMGIIQKIKAIFCKTVHESPEVITQNDKPISSPIDDLPSTVVPLTAHDRHVAEMRNSLAGQRRKSSVDASDNVYIWRKADEFVQQWLPKQGYAVLESSIFQDCIAYRCNRKNCAYTIFMYAYGKRKTSLLDGEHCSKFKSFPFAQNSTILILYLKVDRSENGNRFEYKVGRYGGTDSEPELWRLNDINGMPILEYYPREEMMDQLWQFMYAFNREDTDIYDCIITDENPTIECGPDYSGLFWNSAFYGTLRRIHQEHGDMRLGYIRINDVVYCSVPYIDGLGFFSWSSEQSTNRMHDMGCHPFENGKIEIREFIKTDLCESDHLFDFIPKLAKAVPLPPVLTERFAINLFFENGECRKYVLPVPTKDSEDEAVSYMGHVFTDDIWASASVVSHHESRYAGYPECGSAITFKNGFFIAGTRCYMESELYSEPELIDEIIYSDGKYQIKKLWNWNINSIYEDSETGLLKILISGQAFNWHGKSVFASVDGRRMTSLTFDLISNFEEGLACVAISGYGYGFIDKDMNFVIPMKYDEAYDIKDGMTKVRLGESWRYVDTRGNELTLISKESGANYQEIGTFLEGMCRVSTLKLRSNNLAYHSDDDYIAGIWGFANEAGEEVIAPQYIYANDFEDGIAIIAKGEWTIDPKWDNEYNQGRYWTEEELWGGIDKNGIEVIPCIFDEIKCFNDCTEVYMAHFGGWENGHWGVIDRTGNWLADPIFEDLDDEYIDGLFAFYAKDRWSDPDNVPLGIYDIKQKKVLFEPQFLDVSFCMDGDFNVEVFDQELGRNVEKIIDCTGKERFKSIYSCINTWSEPYEVAIRDKNGTRYGLINRDGHEILPCIYDIPWFGFYQKQKRLLFVKGGKQGMMDCSGNTIIPAIYHEIHGIQDPFLTVSVGEEDNYKEGLITLDGGEVIPAKYKRIGWCRDKKHFFCCSDGCCEMYQIDDI